MGVATKQLYVLVTPARNEAAYIGRAVETILGQTVRPLRWVIVDDGSTDGTAQIVEGYARSFPQLSLLRRPPGPRTFGAKVRAFRQGLETLGNLDYSCVGNLDADVSMDPPYYERLLREFATCPNLGITGGVVWERSGTVWRYMHSNPQWCVGGATQFFRRECIEAVGGYRELPAGGEDTLVEYLSRECGWEVRAVEDLPIWHHRPSLGPGRYPVQDSFRMGVQEYYYGTSALFEMAKAGSRAFRRPYVVAASARLAGFLSRSFKTERRHVSWKISRVVAKQQRRRLFRDLVSLLQPRRARPDAVSDVRSPSGVG